MLPLGPWVASFLACSWLMLVANHPHHSLAGSYTIPVSVSIIMWQSAHCVSLSPPLRRTQAILDQGPFLFQYDLVLMSHLLQRPDFQIRLHSETVRVRTSIYLFGGCHSTPNHWPQKKQSNGNLRAGRAYHVPVLWSTPKPPSIPSTETPCDCCPVTGAWWSHQSATTLGFGWTTCKPSLGDTGSHPIIFHTNSHLRCSGSSHLPSALQHYRVSAFFFG